MLWRKKEGGGGQFKTYWYGNIVRKTFRWDVPTPKLFVSQKLWRFWLKPKLQSKWARPSVFLGKMNCKKALSGRRGGVGRPIICLLFCHSPAWVTRMTSWTPKCVGISLQHPLCHIVGKSAWNSTDRNLEQEIAQNQVTNWYKQYAKIALTEALLQCAKNINSWICACAQLASTVFKACFARTEAKKLHDQLENSTDTSLHFPTDVLNSVRVILDLGAVIAFLLIDTLFQSSILILWFVWD